jgi:hypothetical protein
MSAALQEDWWARHAGPPVLLALFIRSFKHQHRTDEAWDRRDRGTHLEGFGRALVAGHQFPALLGLVIEDVFQVRRRVTVMGAEVDHFVTQ